MKLHSVEADYNAFQELKAQLKSPAPDKPQNITGEKNWNPEISKDNGMDPDVRRRKLEEAVEQSNKTMETYHTELRFSIHEASGEMLVKVINTGDDSVIREIPPERILDMVAHVKKMLGLIIDKFI